MNNEEIISIAKKILSIDVDNVSFDEQVHNIRAIELAAQYIQDTMKLKKAPFYNGSYVLNDDNLEKYVKSFCNEFHFKVQIEKNNDENLYVFNCRGVCIEIGLFTVEFDDLEINRIDVEIWNKDCTQFVLPGFFELHNVIGLIKDGTI